MWLVRLAITNPYLVAAFAIMLAVIGLLSLARIPIDILPVFKAPAVQVMTYYPGMPASSIEKTITNRIERWVNQAPGARLVESRSVPGVSVVKVYFRDDIDSNEALTLTNSLALGALPNLPPNTLPPVALPFDATGTLPVGILTVRNHAMDDARQKDIARIDVRNMLGAVPGVIAPVVVGGQDRSVMVYLDPPRMEARNLTPMEIVGALRRGNLMTSPGTAYFGAEQMLLDNNAMVDRVEDLNDLPITLGAGNTVLLRDIGRAEDAAAIQTSRVRIDDRNEVFVPIYRQRGASSLSVVDGVRDYLDEMQARLPKGTMLDLVMDQTVAVRSALSSLALEGATGALLVALMILLFLGDWRMTIIATLSIPLAMLGAIIGLYVTGNTLNAMTLGGLALAIGPLVDEAIVELENNHRHHLLGKSRIRAAIDGCREVLVPVMVSAATTFIVLAPLALLPGMAGFLFRPLTLAIGFAMLTSFLLSRTFVPMLCAKFLPDRPAGVTQTGAGLPVVLKQLIAFAQSQIDRLAQRYQVALDLCLRQPRRTLMAIIGLFLISLAVLPLLGREFFPQVDTGQILMRVRAPSNLRLDATEARIKAVEAFIKQQVPADEREMIVSEIGLNPDWSAAYTSNSGQQDAIIRLQLNSNRSRSAQAYATDIRRAFLADPGFADLRMDLDTGGMISTALNYGAASPIDIEISGGSGEDSLKLARQIRNLIVSVPGTADVRVHQRDDAPYLVLDVDRVKAASFGLSAEDVIQQVVVALNSSISISRNFWIDSQSGNQYFVGVQYPEDADRTLEDVLTLPVKGLQATSINLGSVVQPRRSQGAVEINHAGLRRVANVLVNLDGRDLASVAGDIRQRISQLPITDGLHIRYKGEDERMSESFQQLGIGLALAILLVYLLQVMLFRSWSGPGVILLSVPMGFIGVIWMLLLTGTTLNIQSLMGTIFLVGVAVNNGILLVEFANARRLEGLSAVAAIRLAAATRFRPILMTFLATVLALLPMAIGFGHGHEANIPLARAVVGGMLSSTALTLLLVPVMYTLLIRRPKPRIDLDAALNEPLSTPSHE
jgi:CzcA family heavy metal efflux pump